MAEKMPAKEVSPLERLLSGLTPRDLGEVSLDTLQQVQETISTYLQTRDDEGKPPGKMSDEENRRWTERLITAKGEA